MPPRPSSEPVTGSNTTSPTCTGATDLGLRLARYGTVDHSVQFPAITEIMGNNCAQAFRLAIPQRRTDERRAGWAQLPSGRSPCIRDRDAA